MLRLALLASIAALAAPSAALAADSTLDAFQAMCSATSGDYPAVSQAATAAGWADANVEIPADPQVSLTDKMAKVKTVDGAELTLIATRGLRHSASGDLSITTCKIASNKPDAGVMGRAKSWIGFDPDGGDDTLATYFVKPGAKFTHVPKEGLDAALAAGGFALVKVQQDPDGTVLVFQKYAKAS